VLPFTVDAQDGYGDLLEQLIISLIELAVGCNLEDLDLKSDQALMTEVASKKISRALGVVVQHRVLQFVANARTDIVGEEERLQTR
jgi:2-methylisocitrate lyase-like PEP mutase family enzyme